MSLIAHVLSDEMQITEDWGVIKIVGSRENFEGVDVGDVVEYVPSWSEYKLSDLDRQMYEKGFRYKRILVMKNNENVALTNELIPVTIDTATPISDGKMRSDCGDIRFYWWDETNQDWIEISYWVDNDTVNTSSTKIILRIPSVSASGYVNIVMYYGAMHYGRKDDLTIGYDARVYEGKYLSFDGVDDYGEISNTITSKPFSLVMRVRLTNSSTSNLIESRSSPFANGGRGFVIEDADPNGIYKFGIGDGTNYVWSADVIDLSDGNWHWVVVTVSSTTATFYVNGVSVGTLDVSNISDTIGGNTIIKIGCGLAGYLKGDISFVGLWSVELTQTDIQNIMSGKVPTGAVVLLDDSGISGSTWIDSSGNGNDATLYGNPTAYKIGRSLDFDGVDDYVAVQNLVFNRSDYTGVTVLAFVKSDSQKYNVVVSWDRSEYFRLALGDDTNGGYVGYVGWDILVDGVVKDFKSSVQVNDGRVHMIGGVFDGSSGIAKIIIDGQVDSDFTNVGSNLGSGLTRYGYIGVGSESNTFDGAKGPENYFEGKIYAVYIYNRALSDTEIQVIYDNPNDPSRAGLVLWLAPDSVDDVNGVWKDKSGLGNDGTIYGAQLKEVRTVESTVQTSKVMSFDGVDDVVNVGRILEIENGGSLTLFINTYLKKDDVNSVIMHIADYYTDAYGEGTWFLRYETGSYGNKVAWFVYGDNGTGTITPETRVQYYIPSDGWYDIVAIYDANNGQIKLYINGQYIGAKTKTSIIYGNLITGLNIGARFYNASSITNDFSGIVKGVMIWNRALSDTEIQSLYNDPNNPPLDGLVLWLDGTSIDEQNGKWLNKAPALKSGYVEPLDGVIYGATPTTLLSSAWSDEIDMNNGVGIVWRGKVVKKVESSTSIVLYVRMNNLGKLLGEVV